MAFRFSFLFKILQRIISSVQFLFFWLVITNFKLGSTVSSWSFKELLLLIAFFELNFAMFFLFAVGFFSLPYLVPSGKLDSILILPIGVTRALIGENLSPDRFIRIVSAGIILFVVISIIDAPFTLIIFGLILSVMGSILENIFFMTLNLLSFWVGNMGAFVETLTELDFAKQFPLTESPRLAQFILTFIVPIIFISTFPASVITGRIEIETIIYGLITLILLLLLWIFLFKKLWEYGLKNYQSGGSL